MFKVIGLTHPKPRTRGVRSTIWGSTRRSRAAYPSCAERGACERRARARRPFHRIAEMAFDDPHALERSAHSQQWKALREDAGVMVGKFGVKLDVGIGWEDATSFGGGFDLDGVDRLLATTRAVRKRLDLSRAVPRELILECIGLSQQAPTGSNRQGWRWLVVTEAAKRKELSEIYKRGGAEYLGSAPGDTGRRRPARRVRVGAGLSSTHEVPRSHPVRAHRSATQPLAAPASTARSPAVYQPAPRSRGPRSVPPPRT